MKPRSVLLLALVLTLALAGASPAPAELIGIDFAQNAGSPVNWNRLANPSSPLFVPNLLGESGVPSGVSFQFTNTGPSLGPFAGTPLPGTIPIYSNNLALLDDYWFGTGIATATFGNLQPGAFYDVYAFGLRAFRLNNEVTITGLGAPIVFNQIGTANQLFVNGELGSNARTLESYAVPVQASAVGTITLSWRQDGPEVGWAMGGLAIADSAIPEPSTLVLLGTGAIGLVGYGWRRRRPRVIPTK